MTDVNVEREALALLDRIVRGTDDAAREAAAADLARLGIQRRASTLPRGTMWAAAEASFPRHLHLQELTAVMGAAGPALQAQIAAALGQWGDGTVVRHLSALVKSGSESVHVRSVAALGTIGGPVAAQALIDAISGGSDPVAQTAIKSLRDLLTGGQPDDSHAADTILRPPPEHADEFASIVARVGEALRPAPTWGEAVRITAADLQPLLERLAYHAPPEATAERFEAFAREVETVPTGLGDKHLTDEEIMACAIEQFGALNQERCQNHSASCGQCALAIEQLVADLEPLETTEGEARWEALVAQVVSSIGPHATPVVNHDAETAALTAHSVHEQAQIEVSVNFNINVKITRQVVEFFDERMPLLSQLLQTTQFRAELGAVLGQWLQIPTARFMKLVGVDPRAALVALAQAIEGPRLEASFGGSTRLDPQRVDREERLARSVRAFIEAEAATEDVKASAYCLARSLGEVDPTELDEAIRLLEAHLRRADGLDARVLLAMCYRKRGRNDDADDEIRRVRAALKQYMPGKWTDPE